MCHERMAPFAAYGRKLFFREPCVEPAGQAREDWKIMLDLGCKLGYEEQCFGGDVEAALDNILQTAGLDVTVDDLRANPEGLEIPGNKNEEGKHASGKLRKGRAARLQHAVRQAGVRLRDPQGFRLRGASRVRGAGAHPLRAHRGGQALPARSERQARACPITRIPSCARSLGSTNSCLNPSYACTLKTRAIAPSATATWYACSTIRTR